MFTQRNEALDGLKIRLLKPRTGRGEAGDVMVLSASVARKLIQEEKAEEITGAVGLSDGLKVRLLEPKNQHGETSDGNGRPFTSSHGEVGDVVVLSNAVARDLIRNGEALEVL